jgi:hypothetical protein
MTTNIWEAPLNELHRLIGEVVNVEDMKKQAESIRLALHAAGVPDLPDLPWEPEGKVVYSPHIIAPSESRAAIVMSKRAGKPWKATPAPRAMQTWTVNDDQILRAMYRSDDDVPAIADKLGRSRLSVRIRVSKLTDPNRGPMQYGKGRRRATAGALVPYKPGDFVSPVEGV